MLTATFKFIYLFVPVTLPVVYSTLYSINVIQNSAVSGRIRLTVLAQIRLLQHCRWAPLWETCSRLSTTLVLILSTAHRKTAGCHGPSTRAIKIDGGKPREK